MSRMRRGSSTVPTFYTYYEQTLLWIATTTTFQPPFPNEESITQLLGAVLTEQNKEWLLQNRYLPQHSMAEIEQAAENDVIETLPLSVTDILPDRKAGSEFPPP